MNIAIKRLDAMRANPRADWKIADVEVVAKSLNMAIRKSGGSHVVFSHTAVATRLTVPSRRPIKPIYIVKFVELVDKIRGMN
jgi:predicted RNA binding protein YcfA (HicA-like mRNA interferase family)